MKSEKIIELEDLLKREYENLSDLEQKIRDSEKEIRELHDSSLWSDSESSGTFFLCILGSIVGVVVWYFDGWNVISFPLIVLCGGITFLGLMSVIFISIGSGKHNSNLKKIENEMKKVKSKIESLKDEIGKNKEDVLNNLKLTFIQNLDSNEDNTIDVIQQDNEFMKILKSNQKIILDMEKSENRDFIKKFVKISNFLIDKEGELQSIFQRINDVTTLEQFDTFKSNLLSQIHFYNILRLNSLQMISSFIDDDRINFYLIYEKFDKLGVWNSNFENQFLFKIDLMNSNIERLIIEIKEMSDTVNSSLNDLTSIIEDNTFSLSDKLKEIGSKLDVSNLLSSINTYQNYKTNKRLG